MNSRQRHQQQRLAAFKEKCEQRRLMLHRVKNLCIERKVVLEVEKNRVLRSRYCELVTEYANGKTKEFVMLEFENPKNYSYTLHYIYSFGTQLLYDQIGVRCVCERVLRTEGDRVQMYLSILSSPRHPRKTNIQDVRKKSTTRKSKDDSAFSEPSCSRTDVNMPSDSSSERLCDRDVNRSAGSSPERKRDVDSSNEDTVARPRPQPTGSIAKRSFNGREVPDFVIFKSSGIQTDVTPVQNSTGEIEDVAKIVPPTDQNKTVQVTSSESVINVESSINKPIQLARLREYQTFSAAREYLAYYRHHKDFGFKGKTYLTLEMQLRSAGLDISKLEEYYYEAQSGYYTKEAISEDLEQCRAMLWTERMVYLDRVRTHARSMSGRRFRIPGHDEYNSIPSGRCDPECCTLM